MTELGAGAAGVARRLTSPAIRRRPISDRVDAGELSIQRTEPAGMDPVVDRPLANPQIAQLPPGNHPVLPTRQLADRPVNSLPRYASSRQSLYLRV
jgi:hypothetical protein